MSCPLLCAPSGSGYPVEYLVARIRARMGDGGVRRLLPAAESAPLACFDDREIEHAAQQERHWLHHQMDGPTRGQLFPVFVYSELGRLFNLLRLREEGHETEVALFADTLLHHHVINAYHHLRSPLEFITVLDGLLGRSLGQPCGLASAYAKRGLAGAEERWIHAVLTWGQKEPWPTMVRAYSRHLIDRHNSRKLYQWQRWQLTVPCPLIEGGRHGSKRLTRMLKSGTLSPANPSNGRGPEGALPLELASRHQLRAMLLSHAREHDALAVILLYLDHLGEQQVVLRTEACQRHPSFPQPTAKASP